MRRLERLLFRVFNLRLRTRWALKPLLNADFRFARSTTRFNDSMCKVASGKEQRGIYLLVLAGVLVLAQKSMGNCCPEYADADGLSLLPLELNHPSARVKVHAHDEFQLILSIKDWNEFFSPAGQGISSHDVSVQIHHHGEPE